MPTAAGSDVVPLRSATKQKLAELKGTGTFDDVITALLATSDREAMSRAREQLPRAASPSRAARAPDEELALADLAARRWEIWEREGRVRYAGPRLIEYKLRKRPRRQLDVKWSGRRGLSP